MTIAVRGSAPLIQVFDMPTSLRFYRDALGFEVVSSAGDGDQVGWALLQLNGVELMLNTAYEDHARPLAPDPTRLAAHADATIYFGCPDVDGAYAHLRERGVDAEPPFLTSYGFRALALTDPDGYGLCFHWPATPESIDSWRVRYGFDPERP